MKNVLCILLLSFTGLEAMDRYRSQKKDDRYKETDQPKLTRHELELKLEVAITSSDAASVREILQMQFPIDRFTYYAGTILGNISLGSSAYYKESEDPFIKVLGNSLLMDIFFECGLPLNCPAVARAFQRIFSTQDKNSIQYFLAKEDPGFNFIRAALKAKQFHIFELLSQKLLARVLSQVCFQKGYDSDRDALQIFKKLIDPKNEHIISLLYEAIIENRLELAYFLLESGINIAIDRAKVPLIYAVWRGEKELIMKMLSLGLDVKQFNLVELFKFLPTKIIDASNPPYFSFSIADRQWDENASILQKFVSQHYGGRRSYNKKLDHYHDIMVLLQKNGAPFSPTAHYEKVIPVLILANQASAARFLLENGIVMTEEVGKQSLIIASLTGNADMVEYLIALHGIFSKKALVDCVGTNGFLACSASLYGWARAEGEIMTLEQRIKEKNSAPSWAKERDQSALEEYKEEVKNHTKIFTLLLKSGAGTLSERTGKLLDVSLQFHNLLAFEKFLSCDTSLTQNDRVERVLKEATKIGDLSIIKHLKPSLARKKYLEIIMHNSGDVNSGDINRLTLRAYLCKELCDFIKDGGSIDIPSEVFLKFWTSHKPQESYSDLSKEEKDYLCLTDSNGSQEYYMTPDFQRKAPFSSNIRFLLFTAALDSSNKVMLNALFSKYTPWKKLTWDALHKRSYACREKLEDTSGYGYTYPPALEDIDLSKCRAAGLDLNVLLEDGSTILHDALFSSEKLASFLKAGVKVDIVNKQHRTPLQLMLLYPLQDIDLVSLRVLLNHHASLRLKDSEGCTPLLRLIDRQLWVQEEDFEKEKIILALFLDMGSDINAQDNKGQSALHLCLLAIERNFDAIQQGKSKISEDFLKKASMNLLEFLLRKGADPMLKNSIGLSAIDSIPLKKLPYAEVLMLLKTAKKESHPWISTLKDPKVILIAVLIAAIMYLQLKDIVMRT